MNKEHSVDIIIPTFRPDADLGLLLRRLGMQSVRPHKIIIINTDENEWTGCGADKQVNDAVRDICEIHHITKAEFNHGFSRNYGAGFSNADYFICMTQDAIPADEFLIEKLISEMGEKVKMVYARQIPKNDARDIEKITRKFNYPDDPVIKGLKDIDELGIKTFFASNVCCAYDHAIFDELGGFVDKTDFNEDMIYASKLVKAEYLISYCADARVMHSHNYTPVQQFKRNYHLAVSQAEHPEVFGGIKSESEGIKLVKETAGILKAEGKLYLIPELIFTSGMKYLGYRAGKIPSRRSKNKSDE